MLPADGGYFVFSRALANTATKRAYPFTAVRDRSPVASRPELQRVPDFTILVAGMELWGYDLQAFNELARLLETRNNAAHRSPPATRTRRTCWPPSTSASPRRPCPRRRAPHMAPTDSTCG